MSARASRVWTKSFGITALAPPGHVGQDIQRGAHLSIIGDDFSVARTLRGHAPNQPANLDLTLAETCAMSARPASCAFSAAMTLPIAAMPPPPALAIAAVIAASISASFIRCGR